MAGTNSVTANNILKLYLQAAAIANIADNASSSPITNTYASAAAHGHRWGLIMWWILDRLWPFGKDPVNGRPHCKGAVESDIARAQSVIAELQGDGTLQEYLKKFP